MVSVAGRPVLSAYMVNGTWEAVIDMDAKTCDVACDTPNVRFSVEPSLLGAEGPRGAVSIHRYFTEYPPADTGQNGTDFVYPGFAKYVRLAALSRR